MRPGWAGPLPGWADGVPGGVQATPHAAPQPWPPTHRGSWSPLRPARASCHPSSSPKASCSRKPSRWVAPGSQRCRPWGAQVLGRRGLSPAAGQAFPGPVPRVLSPCSPPEPAPLASRSPLSSSSPLPSALPDSLKADVARPAATGGAVGGTVSAGLQVVRGMLAVVCGRGEGRRVGRLCGVLLGAGALGGGASLRRCPEVAADGVAGRAPGATASAGRAESSGRPSQGKARPSWPRPGQRGRPHPGRGRDSGPRCPGPGGRRWSSADTRCHR